MVSAPRRFSGDLMTHRASDEHSPVLHKADIPSPLPETDKKAEGLAERLATCQRSHSERVQKPHCIQHWGSRGARRKQEGPCWNRVSPGPLGQQAWEAELEAWGTGLLSKQEHDKEEGETLSENMKLPGEEPLQIQPAGKTTQTQRPQEPVNWPPRPQLQRK